jgi:hypothetical protein
MREIDTDLNELICAGQDISEHWPLKTRESIKMLEKKVYPYKILPRRMNSLGLECLERQL